MAEVGSYGRNPGLRGIRGRRTPSRDSFATCVQRNIETLSKYEFGTIVTGCAHCFNTLKNEYSRMGGHYEIVHHSKLIHDLVRTSRLQINANATAETLATLHDPCYLGRYNG